MSNEEIEKLFITFLGRYPNQYDIGYHINKTPSILHQELLKCDERKQLISGPRIINNKNYPNNKPIDEDKVKIAIGSHKKYYKKTLPIILPSLIYAGIKKTNIIVFIAGEDTSYQETYNRSFIKFQGSNKLKINVKISKINV